MSFIIIVVFIILGIPPDQDKSNMEDYKPFLKSCILKTG